MADISKIKLGNDVYTIKDATARAAAESKSVVIANPEETTASNLTSIKIDNNVYNLPSGGSTVVDSETNGNIVVDGDEMVVYELPKAYKDYLDAATFKKPEISTFQLLTSAGTSVAGTYESGVSITVAKIKHTETNIDNINGNLVLNSLTIAPSDTAAVISLETPETVTTTTTYTLSGTDVRGGAISKSATITFNRYAYSKLTTETTAPTTSLTKQAEQSSFKTNGADFTYTAGQYLYIYLTESGKQAQTNVLGQWVDVTSNVSEELTITQANGATCTYYAYQIGPFVANGTAKYRVK